MFGRLQDLLTGFDKLSLSGLFSNPQAPTPAQAEPVEARARHWPLAIAALASLTLGANGPTDHPGASKDIAASCGTLEGWSDPAPPAHIYGNTWYVGTCGITVVLIESSKGLVLIDSGPEDAAPRVLANIRALGFDPKRIKWILNTHEHFDHSGGIEALRKATGAKVIGGADGGEALRSGQPYADDPQFALLKDLPTHRTRVEMGVTDKAKLTIGDVTITAHSTPVHMRGSTSWTWRSCEGSDCRTIAYADSTNTISAPAYRFTDHPKRVAAARTGLDTIAALPCEILVTPHPSASDLFQRLSGKAPLAEPNACAAYAQAGSRRLDQRLAGEAVVKDAETEAMVRPAQR
jgi:metallo-beta-lactamase class B